MDLTTFVKSFVDRGRMAAIASDPRLQFGTTFEPLLFSRFLPVVTKDSNIISDDVLGFSQVVADDGSPSSPPQIKNPGTYGSALTVRLGHIDLAMQVDGETISSLRKLLAARDQSRADLVLSEWLALNIRLGIEAKAELQRVEAIALAQVTITNKDGQTAIVALPNPPGSRTTVPSGTIAAPSGWYDPGYDPMPDLLAQATYLKNNVQAVVLSSRVLGVLLRSPSVRQAMRGTVTVTEGGELTAMPSVATRSGLDSYFLSMGLPAPTVYDTEVAGRRVMEDSKVIFIGNTPTRTRLGDTASLGQLLTGTIGYYGEGISPNQIEPGLVIAAQVRELKPTGIYVEGYREGFPVIKHSDRIAVLTIPVPTP